MNKGRQSQSHRASVHGWHCPFSANAYRTTHTALHSRTRTARTIGGARGAPARARCCQRRKALGGGGRTTGRGSLSNRVRVRGRVRSLATGTQHRSRLSPPPPPHTPLLTRASRHLLRAWLGPVRARARATWQGHVAGPRALASWTQQRVVDGLLCAARVQHSSGGGSGGGGGSRHGWQ